MCSRGDARTVFPCQCHRNNTIGRYSSEEDDEGGGINPFSAGNSVRPCHAIGIVSAPQPSSPFLFQKLVEMVRSRDKKKRRRRVGAAADEFAVELSDVMVAEQGDDGSDL